MKGNIPSKSNFLYHYFLIIITVFMSIHISIINNFKYFSGKNEFC